MTQRMVRITEKTVTLQCAELLLPHVEAQTTKSLQSGRSKPSEAGIFLALTAVSLLLSLLLFLELWSGS
ncbi:MAG: hypothetical protein HW380_38 [Magnetococcales bacterium]|nr:hypothetical protein [Magnetococcales bacterium]HIJ83876.1 hypothetical protein [Magnetococcales bacterium]